MSERSEGKIIRLSASEIPELTPEELDQLEAIDENSIDTSDIPDMSSAERLFRDESGQLPRKSAIRDAVSSVMAERHLTAYALWKEARVHCPTISESAVGEFLKGKRQIGLDYAEALMAAAGLTIVRSDEIRNGK
jgi:hypothetical protein